MTVRHAFEDISAVGQKKLPAALLTRMSTDPERFIERRPPRPTPWR